MPERLSRLFLVAVALATAAWSFWAPITLGLDFSGGSFLEVEPKNPAERDAALGLVRRTLDEANVERPSVVLRGDTIRVELPGAGEREVAAIEERLRPSTLEIRTVRDQGEDRSTPVRLDMLEGAPIVTAADLVDATVDRSMPGEPPRVNVRFTKAAGDRFADYTAAHKGERLAILIDGEVLMAPVIYERIPGGTISITMGRDGGDDPARIADRLNATGVEIEVTSRMTIEAAVGPGWGLPVLRGWAVAALLAAIAALLKPSRLVLGAMLALLGPLAGLAALLSGMNGTFTSMAYPGALATVPASLAIIGSGLRGDLSPSIATRLRRAWPGWAAAGITFVGAQIVFATMPGPPRGASAVAAMAAIAVAVLGVPALFAYAPQSAKD